MKLSDELALKLRLAKAYVNTNCKELERQTGVKYPKISRYCNGDIGKSLSEYETVLKAMGYELEIKMRRVQE